VSRPNGTTIVQRPIPDTDGWLVRFGGAREAAALKLFCFTFAGGSAIDFRDWSDCPADIDVYAVQLPGRGTRFHENALTRMDQVIDPLIRAISNQIDRPFAFFGHSLGARVAFAVTQRLKTLASISPRLLAVSASRAPGRRTGVNVANLSDAAFHLHLLQLGGTPPDVLANRELMDLMTPVLRADFMLHDSFTASPLRLDCPILACGGRSDRSVAVGDLEAWRDLTDGDFELRLFPGGHFYLWEERGNLIGTLTDRLRFGSQMNATGFDYR
jgi:medium-chain acyl-[acyl-carrier-protein] hydrolase